MTKEEILQLDRIEEYLEGNQLEAKAAQGGLPDTISERKKNRTYKQ